MGAHDEAWAAGVDERDWPSELAEAVRLDPTVLGLSRASESLKAWKSEARATSPEGERARACLILVAEALTTPAPIDEDTFDHTDPLAESLQSTPPAVPEAPLPPLEPTPEAFPPAMTQVIADAAILDIQPLELAPPPEGFDGADEPTTASSRLTVARVASNEAPLADALGVPPAPEDFVTRFAVQAPPPLREESAGGSSTPSFGGAARVDVGRDSSAEGFQDEERPTHHIDLSEVRERLSSSSRRASSVRRREPSRARPSSDPGVSSSPKPSPRGRPPASKARASGLAVALVPLVKELMPLPTQRRSRRFWARWREVAGDQGVRREHVELLLETVGSSEVLLAELVAEAQRVDPSSVLELLAAQPELVAQLRPRAPSRAEPSPAEAVPRPATHARRPKPNAGTEPLVGASVDIELLSDD